MKYSLFIFSIIGLCIISSCDKVDCSLEPCAEPIVIEDTTNSIDFDTVRSYDQNNLRYVLLEEFTGHTCNNCPEGAQKIEDLIGIYDSGLVAVGIHAGTFAETSPGTGKFETDHTTEEGETYLSTFNVMFYPTGMVSRIPEGSLFTLTKDQWESKIQDIIYTTSQVDITIQAMYNVDERKYKMRAWSDWITDGTGNLKIQAYLVENNIIDWQKVGANDVEDYVHKHMLRKVIGGTWGEPLTNIAAGGSDTLESAIYTMEPHWKEDDCEFVVFIYDADSYEVLQTNLVHLTAH